MEETTHNTMGNTKWERLALFGLACLALGVLATSALSGSPPTAAYEAPVYDTTFQNTSGAGSDTQSHNEMVIDGLDEPDQSLSGRTVPKTVLSQSEWNAVKSETAVAKSLGRKMSKGFSR